MTPVSNGFLQDLTITEQPTKTYKMDLDTGVSVRGYTDEQEAMKQAIYKILNTERYKYVMYSWNYGVELEDLFGEPVTYVVPELERRITEALTQDGRIQEVTDFEFDTSKRGTVHVTFVANTKYGGITAETEVNI
jgi:phage baseplate assembly protein W